jgi:Sigma-70, region 4
MDRMDIHLATGGRCMLAPDPCCDTRCRYHLDEGRVGQDLREPCCLKLVAAEGRMTLDAVGKVLGLTRERVRQIETAAVRELGHHLRRRELRALRRLGPTWPA